GRWARATFHRGAARRFGRNRSIARRTQGRVGLTAAWRQVMGAGTQAAKFYGWRVVNGAFVLAAFGWGIGFFGPPVFLSAVRDATGWPVALVSTAVTAHFLVGAAVGANLPSLYRRFRPPPPTQAAAPSLAARPPCAARPPPPP